MSKFVSGNLGGVAVLVVLAVAALSLVATVPLDRGVTTSWRWSDLAEEDLFPKEKVRPEDRREKKEESCIGGTGTSWMGISVELGNVDEELNFAEEAELSYKRPVEAE